MLDLGQPVVDLMLAADAVEDVLEGMNVPVVVGELDAVIRCPAAVCLQTVRGMRSTWPFVQGCLILVSRWSI